MKSNRKQVTVTVIGRDCLEDIRVVTENGQWMTEDVNKQWREQPEQQFLIMTASDEGTSFLLCPSIPQLELILVELSKEHLLVVEAFGELANAAYTSLPNHGAVISEHADGALH